MSDDPRDPPPREALAAAGESESIQEDAIQTAPFDPSSLAGDLPASIGRYRIVSRLGTGGFGLVFKAYDDQLQRDVAIKVLIRADDSTSTEGMLVEARLLAQLDHPAIVPVYDVGRNPGGHVFVVSKLVEGRDLAHVIRGDRPDYRQAARLILRIAQALDYAHCRGIIHRDVKPANILVHVDGSPVLADFGLAMRDSEFGKGVRFAGTPAYMSPEQARHEGHRVDGRSDIYSLGTVMYELLTGSRPFHASTVDELLDCVRNVEVRPPRQINQQIPRELERICLRALAKRAADRYSTAGDMAGDLEHWEASCSPHPPLSATAIPETPLHPDSTRSEPGLPVVIVPRGLRPFEATDSDFFLHLVPGPRDRDGLPESIRFWKNRIEEQDPDAAFRVGLLLGPSGSGKSSLLRAGVLPRLDERVMTVFVEARSDDLESRLMDRLHRRIPATLTARSLPECLSLVRQRRGVPAGQKLLIIIDQFEQWLNQLSNRSGVELTETLRQCDGVTLQALLLVRDDFTLAATRFMEALEEPLLQNRNFGTVDLFGVEHAHKVLAAFGRSFGMLPEHPTRDQQKFLQTAVNELAVDGHIVAVRLAVFAEMVKDKPWTLATLEQFGGMQGIGIAFLEDRLAGPNAHPFLKSHLPLVKRLLQKLLPEGDAEIRGRAQTRDELLSVQSEIQKSEVLDKILSLLDTETRLVTPTGVDAVGQSDSASGSRAATYQLSHDYLVPALRNWLSAEERTTRAGRARLRLRELAEAWNRKPETRRLPTWLEWGTIHLFTANTERTPVEKRMLAMANRRIGLTALLIGVGVTAALLLAWQRSGSSQARALVQRLVAADASEVARIVPELERYERWTAPLLRAEQDRTAAAPADTRDPLEMRRRLNVALALAGRDPSAARFIVDNLQHIAPENLDGVKSLLSPQRAQVIDRLWLCVSNNSRDTADDLCLPAACLLAEYDGNSSRWAESADTVARHLVATRAAQLPAWLKHLQPMRSLVSGSLLKLLEQKDALATPPSRSLLYEALANLAADEPTLLLSGLERAEAPDMLTLWPAVERYSEQVIAAGRLRLAQSADGRSRGNDPTAPSTELAGSLRRFEGVLHEQWAYVTSCPREEFQSLAEQLKSEGYAPRTVRPWISKDQLRVAATFDRTRRDCRWQWDVPVETAVALAESERIAGWKLCDIARYQLPSSVEPSPERMALLWERCEGAVDECRLLVQVGYAEFYEIDDKLKPHGYVLERWNSQLGSSGQLFYDAIWRRVATKEQSSKVFSRHAGNFGELYPGLCLTDLRLHFPPIGARDTYAATYWWEYAKWNLLNDKNGSRREAASTNRVRYLLARGEAELARQLTDELPKTPTLRIRRATALARLGDLAGLKSAIQELDATNPEAPAVVQLKLRLAILEQAFDRLPELVAKLNDSAADNGVLVAQSLALLSAVPADSDPLRSSVQQWRAECFRQLEQSLKDGAAVTPEVWMSDPDFDGVRGDPRFLELLRKRGLDRRYDSLWLERSQTESRLLMDVGSAEHERLAAGLSGQGYRPVCLEVRADPETGERVLASIWQRELPSLADAIGSAKRRARIGATLVRLGDASTLRQVLADAHGRETRSQWIEIAPQWLSVEQQLELLRKADADGTSRGLLLALGSAASNSIPATTRSKLSTEIADWVGSADSALASAAQWCARRWNIHIDPPPVAAAGSAAPRNGFSHSLGQRMITLDPPGPYLMGSPPREEGHETGENLHWQQIGRRFSIASSETTVAQFREFLEDPRGKSAYAARPFSWSEGYTPTPDSPQTSVRWHDAARFCQWLSEREQQPESEWCYPGIFETSDSAWKPPANYLQRRGYRLPTEAEWEYACRAGALSTHSFGDDRQLLPRYAWFLNNADEHSHPVANLMPNDFGLFDMHGNVSEWCHNAYTPYETPLAGYLYLDAEQTDLSASQERTRVVRGGGFDTLARKVRCADRTSAASSSNHYLLGFRVARTESSAVPMSASD